MRSRALDIAAVARAAGARIVAVALLLLANLMTRGRTLFRSAMLTYSVLIRQARLAETTSRQAAAGTRQVRMAGHRAGSDDEGRQCDHLNQT